METHVELGHADDWQHKIDGTTFPDILRLGRYKGTRRLYGKLHALVDGGRCLFALS